MDAHTAGQEGPTPDFIPGWYRYQTSDTMEEAEREAVRVPEPGDYFPITFLRDNERVGPSSQGRGFTITPASMPGHDRFDLAVPPGYWILRCEKGHLYLATDDEFRVRFTRSYDRGWTPPVARLKETVKATIVASPDPDEIGREGEVPVEALGRPKPDASEGVVPEENGWRGTPPAEGTRRGLILDTISGCAARLTNGTGGHISNQTALALADEVESALLNVSIFAEGDFAGRFDRLEGIAEERWKRVGELEATVEAQRGVIERFSAEGKVPAGTRELRIVLEDVTAVDRPPEYRFVELEDQDGRSLGCFPMRPSETKPFLEITIPYGRDDAWVSEVAHQAGGAVSGVFLQEDPEKVMPAEECAEAVATVLASFDVKARGDHENPHIPTGFSEALEQLEAEQDEEARKYLEEQVEKLTGQREEARSGEGRYAEERDCAYALLRWLLPTTVAKRLD